jgi:two-component system sensor histidine kinase MprB
MTLRTRLAMSAALSVAAAIVLSSIAVYFVVRSELREELDSSLRERATLIATRPGGRRDEPFPRIPPPLLGGAGGYVQLVAADGTAVRQAGATLELPVDSHTLRVASGEAGSYLSDASVSGTHVRILTIPFAEGLAIQIARPLTEVDDVLGQLRWILIAIGLGGAAFAALLGLGVAKAVLGPTRRLTEAAEEIATTQDLTRRVDADRTDELGRLAAAFNTMLAALERSVDVQRRLVSDASHELRTPLTSLRTNVDLLARPHGLPDEERVRALADIDTELDELSRLVADVVDLARDGEPQHTMEEVRLDLLVRDAVESAQRRAPELIFATTLDETVVMGSPDRLHRAVANLLDNAVKWSPPNETIEVQVSDGEVSVRDHGPGISEEDLPHIFDRFYRSAAGRSRPGSGLGLAIVRQVADAHSATVSAEAANGGGTIVRIRLAPIT